MPKRAAYEYVERARTYLDAAIEVAPTQGAHHELVELQADLDDVHEDLQEVEAE